MIFPVGSIFATFHSPAVAIAMPIVQQQPVIRAGVGRRQVAAARSARLRQILVWTLVATVVVSVAFMLFGTLDDPYGYTVGQSPLSSLLDEDDAADADIASESTTRYMAAAHEEDSNDGDGDEDETTTTTARVPTLTAASLATTTIKNQPPPPLPPPPKKSSLAKPKAKAIGGIGNIATANTTGATTNSSAVFNATATVAHVISFLTCGASVTQKYKDAMLVLRHSIHQTSIHAQRSNYNYQMYALVNAAEESKCPKHTTWIQQMGYTPILQLNPVNISLITTNPHYRDHVDKTGVVGSTELIKLYAYTLVEHPIVVHWDIDVIVLQPMDDLYDSMLFGKDTQRGQRARSRLDIQQPLHQQLPEEIDAFFTRDIALAKPWEGRQVAQGGFLVAKTSWEVFEKYRQVVLDANFSASCGNHHGGWGDLGYGCKMGSMHYQGVVAYFYDFIYPQMQKQSGGRGGAVELDVCKWNQVAHTVLYETQQGGPRDKFLGSCRQSPIYGGSKEQNRPEFGACHDCRILPVEQTKTVHYTACAKPWQCRYQVSLKKYPVVNATTCGLLQREFYKTREDLEAKLLPLLGRVTTRYKDQKAFHPEYFFGYCGVSGVNNERTVYVKMPDFPNGFEMKQLYGF